MGILKDIKTAFKQGMEQETKSIAMRREKAQDLMHLTDTLESLTGNRDINAPLRMAIRFMAVGVDPLDHETTGRMAEAYAMGKYEFVPVGEKDFQASLDSIKSEEEKKS